MEFICSVFRLYGRQKKHALSSEKYDKSISLIEKVYGPDSMRLIAVLHDYGRVSFVSSPLNGKSWLYN